MITIKNLSVHYSENQEGCVLKDVSLIIPEGSSVVVIGPSGRGKSTLLKAMAGLLKNYSGEILLHGKPVNPKEQTIGYLPQNYGLLPWLTLRENILLGQDLKRKAVLTENEVTEMINLLGLDGLEDRYPDEVSGGQRQRASLARVFLLKPDILLMDEPFSALDAITRDEMKKVFFSLWKRYQITAVIVTHYVDEAIYLGQQIFVLSGQPGQISAQHRNSLFGKEGVEFSDEFIQLGNTLKNQLKVMR